MKLRDITATVTTSYQSADDLAQADTDHSTNPIGSELFNVTITNDTNVDIYVKSSGKSSISGNGRKIASGGSFNYLEVNLRQMFIKAASTPTGSVIITGYKQ